MYFRFFSERLHSLIEDLHVHLLIKKKELVKIGGGIFAQGWVLARDSMVHVSPDVK